MTEADTDIQETTYIIGELCCATEEQLIRKSLGEIRGIGAMEFNLVTHKLRVTHTCDKEAIAQQLTKVGLPGRVETGGSTTGNRSHRRLMVSTAASGVLFLVGAAAHLVFNALQLSDWLFILSILAGGWHIALKASKAVRVAALEMNTLMVVAAIGAVIIGQFAEGAAVIFLFSVSLVLESASTERTRRAIDELMKIAPASGTVLRAGVEVTVPLDEILVGETVIVRPGERIPVDGTVVDGASSVDESAVTGESIPSTKAKDDSVFAGTFNQLGVLYLLVLKPSSDSTIAKVIHLVEKAQSQKASSQSTIERFARIYTPAVFLLAIGVAVLPTLLAGALFSEWFYRSLVLLVIACPCALVISTPVTLASAITNAARNGILIKGGRHLEALASIRTIAFDKTGTMTHGRATVTDIVPLNSLAP
ncbi:MAG TPA: HAD-IC family P-type ATPase, partial [Bacteroidota bacterium]|nr:HAD-IC family P-type ATPase [Bacteroidota bacterium]